MSKKKKVPVAAQGLPVQSEEAVPVAPVQAPKAKKWVSRVCAILFLVACALVVFFVPFTTFNQDWSTKSTTLFETFKAIFAKGNDTKFFGFLPAQLSGKGGSILAANALPYGTALFLFAAVVLFLIALICGKRCLVKIGLVLVFLGGVVEFVGILFISKAKATSTVFDKYAISLIATAIVLFILVCIVTRKQSAKAQAKVAAKAAAKAAAADPVAEAMKGFKTEEVIEAYAYEGGPVAGIEVAEEVYPTVAAIEAQKDPTGAAKNTVASLLGNGFDAFLITLNEQEKNEFIDLYVLRCRCLMPEIPGYVVGGDNKDFFNKVFIYLGQYRDKIPGDLLVKMYNFSMKI